MMKRIFVVAAALAVFIWPSVTSATHIDDLKKVYESRSDLQAVFRPSDLKIRDFMAEKYDLTDLEDWACKWGYKEYDYLFPYSPLALYGTYKDALRAIYVQRSDLQAIFNSNTWELQPASNINDLTDLEDWASKWGYREYPSILNKYAPAGTLIGHEDVENMVEIIPPLDEPDPEPTEPELPPINPLSPLDLSGSQSVFGPKLKTGASFPFSLVTADSVLVVDAASGEVLLARNTLVTWPIASITKLMTMMVVLDHDVSMDKVMTIEPQDNVGGVRLKVPYNSRLTVQSLMYATLVGSANDAAHTLSRSIGVSETEFVGLMNQKAKEIGLEYTHFVDPTGIEVDNKSIARDIVKMLDYALDNYHMIRMITSTAKKEISTMAGDVRELKNTNQLLTDNNNGLYVLGGKTGYLIESQWNLALKVKDRREKPLIAVVFGSEAKSWVFSESERAVKWVWDNYIWP